MVFLGRGRGKGANRGRGRGVGEVAFESRGAHSSQHSGRDSRQAPESLRITVGNDQFRDRKEDNSGRLSPSVSQRLGPPKDNYEHGRDAVYRREDDMMYRREAEMYGQPERDRLERNRGQDNRDSYSRDPYARPEEREYGDRRGLGGGGYEQVPAEYRAPTSQPLFPSGSRSSPHRSYPATHPAGPSPAQTSTSSRPLKSILKKKDQVPEQKPQDKPSGLPGIANYMDDIEDEDKFLYGGEDDRRNRSERERGESGQYRQPPHGIPIEDLRASNIRSAAQAWQPSAPQTTVTGVVSEFVNAQREYLDHSKQQHFGGGDPFQSQPMQQPGGNDLWSMLAKSVQTAQQQQPPPNQFEPQLGSYQAPFNSQSAEPSYAAQPVQEAQAPAAGHDPTIENILKSIGFDFEMSKRMQEKAKQSSGEIVPQSAKPGDPKFINQTASFIGSQMSHEEMMSTLGTLQREREAQAKAAERQPESLHQDFREVDRDMFSDRDRRGSSEASRGRMNSPSRRMNSPSRRLGSPPKGQSPERLQRGCSPVSAEGSPPPPMFNLPPITIKRRSNFDRKGSPVWDRKSPSRSPQRDSDRSRNRPRSRSPSWNRSLSSHGRKRSRSPARKQSLSPVSPASRTRSRSPSGRKSPVIKRTFNLDDISPVFRRRVSPGARKRSISPGRRRSPGRRSSSRGKSPGRRRSRSPYRKRRGSRSPGRRRSRSPQRHSPSPRGRRRSVSPRGRKRGPSSRSRSRERKLRRSTSRDRSFRGSPGRHRRSSSRDRNRRRSRSRSRNHSRSPRKGRSLSVSSDSDIDGPANKQYFSSPLRLSRSEKQNIPRYYDFPPQQGPQGPPDFNGPPFPGYGPGPGPPPGAFPPGSQPGMMPVCPPGPPMFTMPPPGMAPPVGPPPGFPFPPPGAAGPPGAVFAMPGPPMINQPPPSISTDPEMAPPGTVEMPLNIPSRSNLTDIVNEDSRDSQKTDSSSYKDNRRKERSRSRERRGRSRSRERRDRSRSRERGSQTRSDNRSKDRRGEKKSERSGSSSSNRTVLPPRAKPKAEDIEIKASTTSSERVIVIGGKATKLQPAEAENKEDSEKERLKILKEKDNMIAKIKALEVEFKNLKQQEFDLKKKSDKDSKPDPILVENKKLLDEIKKEIVKLNKQKSDFESKHSVLLKKEQPQKREIRVTAKKIPSKDDKGKAADKKEKDVFQVEKGKMMKHYFHDGGDHWCKPCNTIHPNIQDYMHHLSSYKHKQTLPNDFRPWMDGYKANDGMILNKKGIRVPLPGIEFMMPVSAYYCQLCKVFLGDVSFGADHFKCESHYINYKKYLAENPIYEKKYKEEREKVLVANKANKKEQKEKLDMKTRQQTKQNNSEKDARIRANEKKWDKNVDDLDDASAGIQKQETNKSQIKLSLKDQKQTSDVPEKGFGKFNWTRDKKNEDAKDGDKTPEAGQDKEKGKINFNINLSNKTGKSLIGKTGAQKKNPLLPPWQPVGKKTESVGKPGETANLDQFLTTNNGEGKIPVISEKKRISAREILEAFTGKYKEKEAATAADKEKEAATAADQEKMKGEENVEKSSEKDPELTVKTKKEMKEENEKRMMGIDPDSEVPLAEKKPPPPASQNVPLPDQKPSATVDENAVHKVFNSETIDDDEKPVMVTVTVEKEEIPEQEHVKMEEVAETSQEIKIEVKDENEKMDVKSDVLEIKMDIKCEDSENVSSLALTDTKEDTNIKLKSEENIENGKPDIVKKEESSMIMSETVKADIVPKEEKNIVLEKESVTKVEIIIESNDSTIKEDQESVQMDIEDDKKPKSVEMDMEVDKKQESVQIDIEVDKKQESVQMDIEVDKNTEPGDVKVESGDDISEMAEKKKESPEIKDESTKPEAVIDDSDTEIDEPVSPAPAQRGRGRGRGKKRGGGRGRGRGKAKAAPARTTRAKRSAKADIEETVEIGESDNVDNSEANDSNKDLELSSSVKVDKTVSGKKKKSASPRVRKSSLKSDAAKADPEEISDIEELKSDASGISMHMDSDFEVLDDLEDLEILDEAL